MSKTASFEAIGGLEITLPSGRVVKAKPLPWRKAMEFLALFEQAKEKQEPYTKTLEIIVALLPEVVGLSPGDLDELDLGQLDDLVARFFHLGRNGQPPAMPSVAQASTT